MTNEQANPGLVPLPYQRSLLDYLQTQESELWQWFSSNRIQKGYAESVHLDLLKSTYRIEPATQPGLYSLAGEVALLLSLEAPVTFYQSQNTLPGMNAALAYIPGEIHIVFQGPVLASLNEQEQKALLGHEFGHFMLLDHWENQYLTASQILAAMTHDSQAEPAHMESARLLDLYNELFCDRCALWVTDDLDATVCMQVKIETGLEVVSAESYIRQAEEIFDQGVLKTDGVSHPESFIRTRALKLWQANREESCPAIKKMIEGPLSLESLDLLGQQEVMGLTKKIIDSFLSPEWIQTERVMAHARLFFNDYTPPKATPDHSVILAGIEHTDKLLKDYYCYVLLDFVVADRDLEDAPLAAALILTGELGLKEHFNPIAVKELKLKKKQFEHVEKNASNIIAPLDNVEIEHE